MSHACSPSSIIEGRRPRRFLLVSSTLSDWDSERTLLRLIRRCGKPLLLWAERPLVDELISGCRRTYSDIRFVRRIVRPSIVRFQTHYDVLWFMVGSKAFLNLMPKQAARHGRL